MTLSIPPDAKSVNGSDAALPVSQVCCIGAGYVGGPTCAIIAGKNPNLRVTVVDKDKARIEAWNSQHLPVYEPGLLQMVELARDGTDGRVPNLSFSTDVSSAIDAAQLIFIAVNTPTKTCGSSAGKALDLTYVEAVARDCPCSPEPSRGR